MTTHTIKGHIYWQHTKFMKAPAIVFERWDMRDWSEEGRDGRVYICEHSFVVDVPDDFDPRPSMIAGLKAEKEKVRAAFAARITELDEQISKLQAIEFDGSTL